MPTIFVQFSVRDVLLYEKLLLQPELKYKSAGQFSKFAATNDIFEPVIVKQNQHLYFSLGNTLDQSIKYIASLLLPLIFCVEFK